MTTFYRRLRMKYGLTWGMATRTKEPVIWRTIKDAVILIALLIGLLATHAYFVEKDRKETARMEAMKHKTALQPALAIIRQCLKGGDNPIYIGNETWLCGAVKVGERL